MSNSADVLSNRLPATKPGRSWMSRKLLIVPALALILGFFVYPVMGLALDSFLQPEPGFGNYEELLTNATTVTILLRTVRVALTVTVVTLILAYPYAYLMTLVSTGTRVLLLVLVLLPFWTSLMARTFSWVILLQPGGIVASVTGFFGFGEEGLLGTQAGVTIAMTQVLLPFMVLPLYSNMSSIDRRLLAAAQSLGASRWTSFRTVFLPLSVPGLSAGCTLVFILSIGFWITPRLVGSPQQSLVGQLIATKVEKLLDFEAAGALSVLVLLITAGLLIGVQGAVRALGRNLSPKERADSA